VNQDQAVVQADMAP